MISYGTFHLKGAENNFFSGAHRTFSRTDHILGHKSSLGTFKETEIVSGIFSDHNPMRLESITGKTKNTKAWRLNRISNRSLKTPKGIKNMQASDRKT